MGRLGLEHASTPFTCKSRPKHAGRCGRGHSGAYLHYDSPCPMSGFRVVGKVGVEAASTPFVCKSRPKPAGRCGRGLFGAIHSAK